MSGPFGSSQWMYNAGGDFYGYEIDNSLRFDRASISYLNRTASSPTLGTKATWSFWIKKSDVSEDTSSSYRTVFYAGTPNSDGFRIGFARYSGNGHSIQINQDLGSSSAYMYKLTNAFYRDAAGWYHFVISYDSTNATAADRIKVYANGELASFRTSPSTNPSLNHIPAFQVSGKTLKIGDGFGGAYNEAIDAYLADVYFIDGQALDGTSFGETKSGIWIPKEYSGSYGNNGFHLEFAGNANDTSGNGNNWTANNISAYDYMPDSPTLNFAVLNPLYNSISSSYPTPTLSQGNLAASTNSGSNWKTVPTTMYMSTGKWYSEVKVTYTDYVDSFIGFASSSFNGQNYAPSETAFGYQFHPSLGIRHNSAQLSAQTFTQGDIIGLALNMDDNEIKFYKNGSLLYTATGVADGDWSVALTLLYTKTLYANFGQDSSFAGNETAQGNTDANGIGDFYYSVPSGFLALCTDNLPEPVVGPLGDSLSDENFNTVLFSATAGVAGSVTGYGFAPNWLWTKARNATQSHQLFDSVRGDNNILYSNLTNKESKQAAGYFTLENDGFDYGTSTFSSNTYVGWGWKAGTAFSNSAGSNSATIASSGSVNTDAGFSIVSYVGTGVAGTVYHGLSSTPEFITIKDRDYATGRPWGSYHFKLNNGVNPEDERIQLNESTAETGDAFIFNSTAPTSNVFSLGTSSWNNTSGNDIIAYCFHSVDGYSKVGQYVGNYNVDGPFVYTGFRPAFVIIKSAVTTGYHWYMMDSTRTTYNGSQNWLSPSQNTTEDTSTGEEVDFLSNGFKIRTNWTRLNDSGSPRYIYIAFAENPFKYANAR
jgi:hypothetical protein